MVYGTGCIGKLYFFEQQAQLAQKLASILLSVDPYLLLGGKLVGYGK